MVFPPAGIDTMPVIFLSGVGLRCNGPVSKTIFCMKNSKICGGWKNDLVVLVDMGGYIGPVEEGIDVLGRVHQSA